MDKTGDEERVGERVVCGTVWPRTHKLEWVASWKRWVVTRGICNGTADEAHQYRTRPQAVRAWEELVGRPLGTRRLTTSVFCVGIHAGTGREMDEGTLDLGALVRKVLPPTVIETTDHGRIRDTGEVCRPHADDEDSADKWHKVTFEASTDEGRSWYRQWSWWTVSVAKALGVAT